MKCPTCGKPGFTPNPVGRPVGLDEKDLDVARSMRDEGKTLRQIGYKFGVSHTVVMRSLNKKPKKARK